MADAATDVRAASSCDARQAAGARRRTPTLLMRGAWLGFAALLVWSAVLGVREFWVCDDAFISFRYAQNLIEGNGLVYNAGERVEGYTNFLWTLLVAGAMALGGEPVAFGNWLGLGLHYATVALLAAAAIVISRRAGVVALPLAAAGLAVHHHARSFASAGLETALFLLLVTALLLLAARAAGSALTWLGIGLLGVAAAMTRPDGMVAVAVAMAAVAAVAWRTRAWRPLTLATAPWLIVYLPYFAWKWHYYGHPLPNTFYAKSADQEYVSQGLQYLQLYFGMYPALLLGVVGMVLELRRSRLARLLLAFTAAYLAFVAWVGGDFMFARFCLPVTPALLLGIELLRCRLRAPLLGLLLTVGVVAAIWGARLPVALAERGFVDGVTEERANYPPSRVQRMRSIGLHLAELTRGTDTRVVIYGGQAMLAYYGRFAVVIEGTTGLTDAYVARLPLAQRSIVGHEKRVPLDYAVRRGVNFMLFPLGGEEAKERLGFLRPIDFGDGVQGTILTYRSELMDVLRQRGARFRSCEQFLDEYLQQVDAKSREEVTADYGWLQAFYFWHNADPERAAAFARLLQ